MPILKFKQPSEADALQWLGEESNEALKQLVGEFELGSEGRPLIQTNDGPQEVAATYWVVVDVMKQVSIIGDQVFKTIYQNPVGVKLTFSSPLM